MKLKFFATYRDYTGCKETDIAAPADVWALIELLTKQYGAKFGNKLKTPDGTGISEEAIVLVNGRNAGLIDGKDTKLCENDVVSLFPVVAGG